jgi:hypothetical protein
MLQHCFLQSPLQAQGRTQRHAVFLWQPVWRVRALEQHQRPRCQTGAERLQLGRMCMGQEKSGNELEGSLDM